MTTEYTDKRILRSMRDLRAGLLELLEERPIDKISVVDICERSQINKMTFYKYYSDKYDLFSDCIQQLAVELYQKSIGQLRPEQAIAKDPVGFCVRLTDAVLSECLSRRSALRSVLSGGSSSGSRLLEKVAADIVETLLTSVRPSEDFRYPPAILSAFLTGGMGNVIYGMITSDREPDLYEYHRIATDFFTDLIGHSILTVPGSKMG